MNTVCSDIIHIHDGAFCDLALDSKVPLLYYRKRARLGESVVIGECQRIRRGAELGDVRLRILHVIGGHRGQTLRQLERLRNTRAEIVECLLYGIAWEKDLAAEVGKNPRIKDPESRTNHRLGRHAVSKPGA